MDPSPILGAFKEFTGTQNHWGTFLLVLFFITSAFISGKIGDQFTEQFKCENEGQPELKGRDAYINTLCFQQYSDQHYPYVFKHRSIAIGFVACLWIFYISYAYYNRDCPPPDIPLFRRPKIRRIYIAQIAFRTISFASFVIVGWVTNPTDDIFSIPEVFICSPNTISSLNITTVACRDKYRDRLAANITVISVLNFVFLVLSVLEFLFECCRFVKPSYQDRMRKKILNSTQRVKKLFSTVHDKSDFEFDQIFTKLILYRRRVSHKLKQHQLYEREGNLWQYAKPEEVIAKLDNVEDLVKPLTKERTPKNIFVIGRAGIGKTMFCENIIRGWASNQLYKDKYEYAFLLNFRQLNKITQDISLRGLLNSSPHSVELDNATFTRIGESSDKVLLIFDGFDESLNLQNFKETAERYMHRADDSVMPVQALYYKLCTGKLLPKATVITTSRANQVSESIQHDRDINNSRTVEVLGFDEEKIEKYVENYFGADNSEKSAEVNEYIRSRPDLLALCYIPINCFLVCYCLQKSGDMTEETFPTTLTSLYSRIVHLFTKEHFKSGGEPTLDDATIDKLSDVAYHGIDKRQLVFDEMKGIPVDVLTSCGIIHEMPGIVTQEMECSPQYIFLHLTIQEFLAARHIVKQFTLGDFELFLSSAVTDPKWNVVLQFIAGLLSPSANVGTKCPLTTLRDAMFQAIEREDQKHLLLTKCFFEYHDKDFVTDATGNIDRPCNLCGSGVTDADCTAISFVLNHAASSFTGSLDLSANNIGPAGFSKLLTSKSETTALFLGNNSIDDRGARHLTKLDLSHSTIGDEGVQHLKETLPHSHCKLTKLNLSNNGIGVEDVKHLKEALLHSNCKLTELNLSHNKIGDEGVKHLKEALLYSDYKLTKLDLTGNGIGVEGVKHLKEALLHSNCKLTELNLTYNGFGVEGVKHLKEALLHSNCKLTELDLSYNRIGVEGVKHLKEALLHSKYCKLTELNLSYNGIGDEGVKHLKEAVLHSKYCKLTELDLSYNGIGVKGAEHLKEALKHSDCKLTELNLTGNGIGIEGFKHLKEALLHSHCKLTKLNLSNIGIGVEGVKHLKEALLHSNCKLTKLNLSCNEIGVEGVEHLKEALQHSDCKLTY